MSGPGPTPATTAERPASAREALAGPRVRPREKERETPEVAAGVIRLVRALGRRASYDVDALAELARVQAALDEALVLAVAGCKRSGWSYTDVGRVLGVHRNSAQQRFATRVNALLTEGTTTP